MSDPNKILELEETLEKLVSELNRMKTAAETLQDAGKRMDEVLGAAENIATKTKQVPAHIKGFIDETEKSVEQVISESKKVLETLSKTDFNKLAEAVTTIKSDIESLEDEFQNSNRQTISELGEVRSKVSEIESSVQVFRNEFRTERGKIEEDIGGVDSRLVAVESIIEKMNQKSKTRQYVTMSFVILTFFVALAVLLGIFAPSVMELTLPF